VRFSSADDLALGLVVERVSGQPLATTLRAAVLTPFGLEDAWGESRRDEWRPPAMVAARCDLGASETEETEVLDLWGFRGLRMNAEQLLELWSAYTGGAFGSASLTEAAFTPQRVTGHNGAEHGFRVHRTALEDLSGWLHGGGFDEQHLSVVEYPEAELRIAILGQGYDPDLPALGRYAARAVLDWPEPEPIDLPLSAERRRAFLGDYQIGCNTLSIVFRDGRLQLERSEDIVPLAYRGGDVLTDATDPDLRLEFEPGRDGRMLRFVLDDHGQVAIATRLE
jgi:CubicO group peptidase (beta-lactamase class C family)